MSNTPKTASEKQFQEDFTRRLEKWRWVAPDSLNGNTRKVTVQTLIDNWRRELNRLNAEQLDGVPLTDGEFKQVMSKVNAIKNSYEAAKLLSMENGTGKIDGIYRDDNPNITHRQITLTIFKKADVGGGESTYQIAREVSTELGNRFDMVLLINGLPLINIEMKRADVPLGDAFRQFKRYYEDGEYVYNFMAFSQMMVITSRVGTRYFATPKNKESFNETYCFNWADKKNTPINNWEDVIDKFLMVPMAHQMVGDYLIIQESDKEEERIHMLMRPYQVYALQAIELAAFGRDSEDGIPHGGYVWHTTGSGKTITSFKTALFLSTRAGFDKIIFMVDRRELDYNTSRKFEWYAEYEPVTVDKSPSTKILGDALDKKGIVVTTTFKVNELIKKKIAERDFSLQEKKFIFIVDEAHRTTMGRMMRDIKEFFRRKSLFYGFTGTPLFDENHVAGIVNEKSEVIKTTEELFGPRLHEYTIDMAIADRNVLGFHVQYVNTGEFESYSDLRDRLADALASDPKGDYTEQSAEEEVAKWSDLKVETEAGNRGILEYHDETHIPRVVSRILAGWEAQSQARKFNAILTVAYKKRVIDYYEEFKRQLEGVENPIHIAMTVSFGGENDEDRLPREFIEEMFADYGKYTGVEFVAGDKKRGEDAYYADLAERGTHGGSGRNERYIDLIIVADQMLTGWDDKYLNTLYNDRMLELQGLIQAYSRTNRVLDNTKEFGTIINFQWPKRTEAAVDRALKLYGSGGSSAKAIVDTYDVAVKKLAEYMKKMRATLPEPTDWQNLENDDEGRERFFKAFRRASGQLRCVQQYYEYEWNDFTFGITEIDWKNYVGAYLNLQPKGDKPDVTVIGPLPGHVRIEGITIVNAAYIISLIGERTKTENGITKIDGESLRLILEKIQELSNHGEKEQADLLRDFLDDLTGGKIEKCGNADEAFTQWRAKRYDDEATAFAADWGIDKDILKAAVESYDKSQPETIPRLDEIRMSLDFDSARTKHGEKRRHHLHALSEELPKWIMSVKRNYLS